MKYSDLELVFDYVSSGYEYERIAYVSRLTGKTFVRSEGADFDELPEDVFENDDYVEIPHKYDLDLGKNLVWEFVDREIPGLKDKVHGFFRRRGGYARYKSFLAGLDLLDKWHRFEADRTREELLKWCTVKGIPIKE